MKIGIILFEQFHGRKNLGSSRIRGHWLLKNWPEAKLFCQGEKYDAMIYQKAYFIEHAKLFKGPKILDLCDPDWLHWAYKVREMIEHVDAITTSTEMLKLAVENITDKPVYHIPDRVDLTEFTEKRIHTERAKAVSWYGYSDNYDMLKAVLPLLKKHRIDLYVISDGNFNVTTAYDDYFEVTNYKWKAESATQNIMLADFIVNPQGLSGKWRFKSNNKTLTGWAMGMPVATNEDEFVKFLDPEERKKEVEKRTKELKDEWDVKLSVDEMKKILKSIEKK